MILDELKALGNEKRLMIVYALNLSEFCQIHIEKITKLGQVDISRHGQMLIDAGLVETRKKSNRVIYSLSAKMRVDYKIQLEYISDYYKYLLDEVEIGEITQECKEFISK